MELFGRAANIVQVSGMGTMLRQWYLEGAQDIQSLGFLGPDIQWQIPRSDRSWKSLERTGVFA